MDPTADDRTIEATLRAVLAEVLALSPARVARFDDTTPLFGALPELDSMAVVHLLTEIEDRLGVIVEDDDVDGALMASFGSLLRYVRSKARR